MLITTKRIIFFYLLIISLLSAAQQRKSIEASLYGKWKVVKHDYSGYQKFSFKKANKLNNSLFVIEKGKCYFTNIEFIKPCLIYKWRITPYDTTMVMNPTMDYNYSAKVLRKEVFFLEIIDKKGMPCNNECLLFIKQDTLITIVGGYIYYRIKSK